MNSIFPILKTKRFFLKRLRLSNVNVKYLDWFKDPAVNKHIITSKIIKDIKSLKLYVGSKIKKKNILFLGIFTKNKIHLGNIKFEPISTKKKTAILGILIGIKKWRKRGVLKEIFPTIYKTLNKFYGITRIELAVSRENKNAITAYKKIGFRSLKSNKAKLIKKIKSLKVNLLYFSKNC